MEKPVRPSDVGAITVSILDEMERGRIEHTEAIRLIQRLRLNERETLQAIIYSYDYGTWLNSRNLVNV